MLFNNSPNCKRSIGTTTPNASAQLDIVSTSKGLLIPRMTAALPNGLPLHLRQLD
ncbi:MAG: hypothetical protein IPK57_17645 [Chitinophagaceae bacterium]|nr:hypothetical protein [Chitinophagaceae bacterium]